MNHASISHDLGVIPSWPWFEVAMSMGYNDDNSICSQNVYRVKPISFISSSLQTEFSDETWIWILLQSSHSFCSSLDFGTFFSLVILNATRAIVSNASSLHGLFLLIQSLRVETYNNNIFKVRYPYFADFMFTNTNTVEKKSIVLPSEVSLPAFTARKWILLEAGW